MGQQEDSDIEVDCCSGESSYQTNRRRRRELENAHFGRFEDKEEKISPQCIFCICVLIIIICGTILLVIKVAGS